MTDKNHALVTAHGHSNQVVILRKLNAFDPAGLAAHITDIVFVEPNALTVVCAEEDLVLSGGQFHRNQLVAFIH